MATQQLKVSGPINAVRLEGEIDGTKKILYILLDFHKPITDQLECSEPDALPINIFLYNEFVKLKDDGKEYHFFLETFPDTTTYTHNYTSNYINKLRNTMGKLFDYNFDTHKIVKNKKLPNINFHYIDIRSYLNIQIGNPFTKIYIIVGNFNKIMPHTLNINIIMDIQNKLEDANKLINITYDALYKDIAPKHKHKLVLKHHDFNNASELIEDAIYYIIAKIKNINSPIIKKQIMHIINKNLKDYYNKYFIIFDKITKLIKMSKDTLTISPNTLIKDGEYYNYYFILRYKISNKIYQKLKELLGELDECTANINVLIMDLYFLRRYLDKQYITNGIVWTGAQHSLNYSNILVNMFNFKVTHTDYSKYKDMNILNKKIIEKKIDNLYEPLMELFYPPTFNQCTDFSSFPPLFS